MNRCHAIYVRLRDQLHARLGGVCVDCGRNDELSIDHVDGRNWEPAGMSSHTRVRRYWQEHVDGVRLELRCRGCNTTRETRRRKAAREARKAALRAAMGVGGCAAS